MTNEEAIKRLNKIKAIYKGMDNKSDVKALDMAIKALSAEKTAEWRIVGKTTLHYECSKCGGAGDEWDKFCKHCGAKMKGADS